MELAGKKSKFAIKTQNFGRLNRLKQHPIIIKGGGLYWDTSPGSNNKYISFDKQSIMSCLVRIAFYVPEVCSLLQM